MACFSHEELERLGENEVSSHEAPSRGQSRNSACLVALSFDLQQQRRSEQTITAERRAFPSRRKLS